MRCAIAKILAGLVLCSAAGCSTESQSKSLPPSVLRASDVGPMTFDLALEGERHLRGFEVTLEYDAQALAIQSVEPGPDAPWLDTVRMGSQQGHLIVVATDTRQIPLPRAGTIVRVHYQPLQPGAKVHIGMNGAIGAVHEGSAPLQGAGGDVVVQ
jgi:hypothetical protein